MTASATRSYLAELRAYAGLIAYSFRNARLLRTEPYSRRFLHLFLETGRQGVGDAGFRAIIIGAVIIAFMIKSLSGDAAITMKILVPVVMREIVPLFAAVIVLIRVGTVASAQLSLMRLQGEIRHLQLLGVPLRDYLVVPAMFAIALGTVVLAFYFQLIAVGGGVLLSALLVDLSLRELLEHLTAMMTPLDIACTALKSFSFGLIIAVVNTCSGIDAAPRSAGSLPEALSRTVMQSLFVILLFNALFAWLAYGAL